MALAAAAAVTPTAAMAAVGSCFSSSLLGSGRLAPAAAGLGPRLTGVGVVVPTAFLGLVALVAPGLVPGVLEGVSFEGVLGLLALASAAFAALAAGFLVESGFAVRADLGVSGLVVLAGEGRVRGEAAGFLAAGVAGLLTSEKREPHQII